MPSKSAAPASAGTPTPGEYCCPITGVLMTDAVVDPEGNTYERAAITEWLERSPTSPVTRAPLRLDQLVPNRALQSAIDAFRARRTAAAASASHPAGTVNPAEPAPAGAGAAAGAGGAGAGGAASALMAAVRSGIDMVTRAAGGGDSSNQRPAPAVAAPPAAPLTVLAQPAIGGCANEIDVLFNVVTPKGTARTPVDVCCVVDVSGSMCGAAKVEGVAADEAELSLLDVVKHAVRTIAHVLKPTDRIGVVAYSSTATVAHRLVNVTPAKVVSVELALEKMKPGGQTNLWDGLVTGMDLLRSAATPGRMAAVFLLTDGCPNVIPPRGHMAMLRRYRDQHAWLPALSTFGFGYQLDSKLLKDLAVEGGGTYCFIPDAGFVGTAFVHASSNLLATAARRVVLTVEPLAGATLVMPEGKAEEWDSDDSDGSLVTRTTWGAVVRLDSLQYGQPRSHILRLRLTGPPVPGTEYVSATLKYVPVGGTKEVSHTVMGPAHIAPSSEVVVQHARVEAVEALKALVKSGQDVDERTLRDLNRRLAPAVALVKAAATATKDSRAKKLLKDLTGQATLALSTAAYFKKWGYHYLLSLQQAHARQMCNNFKDPGVQHYGGPLFRTLRDEADALFVKLPPPKPSRPARRASFTAGRGGGRGGSTGRGRGGGRRASVAAPRRRVNMAVYHNARGGCWTGDSMVHMAAGSAKPAREVKAGDRVATPSGSGAVVQCVMKTNYVEGGAEISTLPSGLRLTPWHPVRVNGAWQFPCQVAGATTRVCDDVDAVYSFLLDAEHIAVINGTEAVCLAHGIEGDKVASHPYFGTGAVARDLEGMRGWSEGLVELQTPCVVRDEGSGLIVGLTQASSTVA